MTEILYREATLHDLDSLLALEQGVIEAERPFNSAIKAVGSLYYDIPDLIENPNSQLLIAEYEQRIIATGYVQIRESKPSLQHEQHGYLGFMFVVPEFRGQRINQAILERLMHWGNSKGVSEFYLDVYSQNEAAIRAYEKAGFIPSMLEMKINSKASM